MASSEIKTLTLDGNAYGLNDTVAREQITQMSASIDNKVDKVSGKGLSTNDYTTAEKTKLAGLSNYSLPTASATVKGGVKVGAGLAINNGVLSATGGGTADSVDWANVQNKPTIPTTTSQLTNDSNYVSDANYVHTDNNYTTAEKNKLAGLSNYTLPIASATVKGGVKIGSGINISADGTISVSVSESGGSGSSVPDTTITDVAPEYAASASYMFNVLNNREYRRLHLTDTIHAVVITFTTTTEINSRNEHYILVTNSAKSTTTVGSIAVNPGSFSELIGMYNPVEIPVGKSVEFSFKVYSDGTSRALIVTHSDVL